jgi:hypothetical protein
LARLFASAQGAAKGKGMRGKNNREQYASATSIIGRSRHFASGTIAGQNFIH